MTQLTGDSSHLPELWLKLQFSHDLQIVRNIWDIVSTQVNKIYNTGLVFFGYFNPKILHILPLNVLIFVTVFFYFIFLINHIKLAW